MSMKKKPKQNKKIVKNEVVKPKFTLSGYTDWKIYLILVFFVLFLSAFVRYSQYNYWTKHKTVYFTDGYPAMTTLDAYYWLRYAKEYKQGTYYKTDNDTLMAYPDTAPKPYPVPLLSFLISELSKTTHLSIYKSGLFLIPILASLFVLPIALYFYYAEMPMAGIVGAFVGTFSWMYYLRTSMGRVDTDLLQLFFLFLASLFLMFLHKTKEKNRIFLYSVLIGITLGFFGWWYEHNGIIIVYIVLLIFLLLIKKEKPSTILISVLLLGVFANPLFTYRGFSGLFSFFGHYLSIKSSTSGGFPNIMKTITETEHIADSKVLLYILSVKIIDILGLIGFLISIKFLKIKIVPLLPIIGLGLMAFSAANRSIMFLAPFAGAGIGFIIDLGVSYIKSKGSFNSIKANSLGVAAAAIVIFGLSKISAMNFVPQPSIAADIVNSFVQIKHKINKANIVSWWDYGYAIEDMDGFATYQDGGAHGGARTYFIARALSTDNQTQLYDTISYIDKFGIKSIDNAIKNGEKTTNMVKKVITYDKPIYHSENYLLFTRDMISKFGAISYLGTWNFKLKKSYPMYFQILGCSRFSRDVLYCANAIFDLKKGLINNKIPINRVIFSSNGYVKWQKKYYKNGVIVELILRNNRLIYTLLCDKRTYKTNFNQIYILGNYNKKYFREVYNNFPSARMFEFIK